ncbi:MAG: hypothetical protein AAF372_04105 [Pseudomonadota bacterium]
MARLKAKWNQKNRERTPEQIASAISSNVWLLAADACLSLENEGFETNTQSQRLDVISEFLAFSLHLVDRMTYGELDEDERVRFINALGVILATLIQDNRVDSNGPGEYRPQFVELLNLRMDDYSECSYDDESGPGFSLKRVLGNAVMQVMGDTDKKWIPDYVIDIEAPKIVKGINRVMLGMGDSLEEADFGMPAIPKHGVWGEE